MVRRVSHECLASGPYDGVSTKYCGLYDMETTENSSAEMECEIVVDDTMIFWIHLRYQCSSQEQLSWGSFHAVLLCSINGVVGLHVGTRFAQILGSCWPHRLNAERHSKGRCCL